MECVRIDGYVVLILEVFGLVDWLLESTLATSGGSSIHVDLRVIRAMARSRAYISSIWHS